MVETICYPVVIPPNRINVHLKSTYLPQKLYAFVELKVSFIFADCDYLFNIYLFNASTNKAPDRDVSVIPRRQLSPLFTWQLTALLTWKQKKSIENHKLGSFQWFLGSFISVHFMLKFWGPRNARRYNKKDRRHIIINHPYPQFYTPLCFGSVKTLHEYLVSINNNQSQIIDC